MEMNKVVKVEVNKDENSSISNKSIQNSQDNTLDSNNLKSGVMHNKETIDENAVLSKLGMSAIEYDGLKETANIGTGNASIALSNILKRKVNISLPDLKVSKLSEVSKIISFPSGTIVGVYSKIEEGLKGNIITMFSLDVIIDLLDLFFPGRKISKSHKLEENEKKLITKIGTATYMSYLSSLAKFFEKKIYFNAPNLVTSLGDSIFDFMSLGVDDEVDVLIIKLGFEIDKTNIKGDFFLLFTINSLSDVLSNLKNKVKMDDAPNGSESSSKEQTI